MKIVVIVLGENTETNFIKRIFFQGFQCLFLQFFVLQIPYIAGSSNAVIRCSILIGKIISTCNTNRSMVVRRRWYYGENTGQYISDSTFFCCLPTISSSKLIFRVNIKGSLNFKGILVCKRRHKSYFINTISIIKTIYRFLLIFTAKSAFDPLITKWISLFGTAYGHFKNAPFFYCFCIIQFHYFVILSIFLAALCSFQYKSF